MSETVDGLEWLDTEADKAIEQVWNEYKIKCLLLGKSSFDIDTARLNGDITMVTDFDYSTMTPKIGFKRTNK